MEKDRRPEHRPSDQSSSGQDQELASALEKLAGEGIIGNEEYDARNQLKKPAHLRKNDAIVRSEVIEQLHQPYNAEGWQRANELTLVMTALAQQQRLYEIPNEKQADRAAEALKNHHLSAEAIRSLEILNTNITQLCRERLPLLLPDFIPDAERDSLRDPKNEQFGLKPLEQQMRYLLARSIVERCETTELVDDELVHDGGHYKSLLKNGINAYVNVTNVDVPMYDSLYEDFDKLRQEEADTPLEIYLGRDGILAYIGRRSSAAARAAILDPAQRRQMRNNGEIKVFTPHYKYFVYNRKIMVAGKEDLSAVWIYRGGQYVRDDSPEKQTKRDYIAQAGIDVSENPHFYDTGFRGSIPEDIMDLMGFSQAEIDRRIHMLTNTIFGDIGHSRRRIRTLDRNYSDEVEIIEGGAKPEQSALGLRQTDDGRLKHVAEASPAEVQFEYLMMREAIHRHYWIRERLAQQPDLNSR